MDLANIPSHFIDGFNHINENIFSTAVNAFVVIILYIISYYAIEKYQKDKADAAETRELAKQENINRIVDLLLFNTYNDCLTCLKALSNPQIIKTIIVPKVDFNKPIAEDKTMQVYLYRPFSSFKEIMQFAENGYLSIAQLKEYLWVQSKYQDVVRDKIVLYDIDKIDGLKNIKSKADAEFTSLYFYLSNKVDGKKNN